MRTKLFLAALAAVLLATTALAAEVPDGALLVKKATIEPMKDPSDAFAIQFVLDGSATQCELLPTNVVKVIVREGLGGTYFKSGFRHGWYFCDIYAPNVATAQFYWMAIMRYQKGSDAPSPLVLQ